jgi:hypothetical protein
MLSEAQSKSLHKALVESFDDFEPPILVSDTRPFTHHLQTRKPSTRRKEPSQ